MEVDKTLLVKLRKETLAPYSACTEALSSAGNNYEEAKKLLFKKSILNARSKSNSSDDDLPEGKVSVFSKEDYSFGVLFVLKAQTDFVTNSEDFKKLQTELGEIILNSPSISDSSSSVSVAEVLKLRSSSDNLTIEEKIFSLSSITKERIELKEVWVSPKSPEYITLAYQHHNSKLGALLTLKTSNNSYLENAAEVRKLVLHHAAAESLFLTEKDVTEEWKQAETEKLRNSLLAKNPNMPNLENIIERQIKKIAGEVTFSQQSFALDSSKKISDILSKFGLTPIWGKKVSLLD